MSDIFISYARTDKKKAQSLTQVLEQKGWTVWWDRDIPAGADFREIIQKALDASECVIVLWSNIENSKRPIKKWRRKSEKLLRGQILSASSHAPPAERH